MRKPKFSKLMLCLALLFKANSNHTGIASAWQSFKTSASSAASSITNSASTQISYLTAKPAEIIQSYSFSPRQLADKAASYSFSSFMPTTGFTTTWNAAKNTANKIAHQLDPVLIPKLNQNNLFKHAPANIRTSQDLPVEEELVIINRQKYTLPALANFLQTNLPEGQNLRIGFCGSGGGYRAMLSTVGFLVGAQRIGLLDTALYMSALSGSTWALGPWTTMNIDINQFRNQLIPKTQNMVSIAGTNLLPAPNMAQLQNLLFNLELKYLFHESITSIDLWGAMISNKLFEPLDNRQDIYLSSQRKIVESGKRIFPIYTAVHPMDNLKYNWFEFTPYEAGSHHLNAFTPTWAFGRKFLNGKSVSSTTIAGQQYAPEQTLGYYLGVFGSAFTVNLEEILNMMKQDESVSEQDHDLMALKIEVIDKLASSLAGIKDFKKSRISPAKVYNFTYGLKSSPVQDEKKLTLVDAGLAFNLPLPPLLRPERALDVIFVFDSSADVGMAGELKKAERYAREHNLKFPLIDYEQAKTKALSVFRDEQDPTIPTIIYLPLVKDMSLPAMQKDQRFANFDPKACVEKDYCGTFNFKYEAEEFETLAQFTEHNLADHHELIKQTFTDILAVKYG